MASTNERQQQSRFPPLTAVTVLIWYSFAAHTPSTRRGLHTKRCKDFEPCRYRTVYFRVRGYQLVKHTGSMSLSPRPTLRTQVQYG
ncbi:hypothetical protein BKA70DRAFT_1433553 [Coprinopsis sp. MPI-PUGE-AT-0042]|nr:hypothetical protein BKA70DRAFT_1433553 [Coprinopsis sp. MPI-PUGE-AT-0042]